VLVAPEQLTVQKPGVSTEQDIHGLLSSTVMASMVADVLKNIHTASGIVALFLGSFTCGGTTVNVTIISMSDLHGQEAFLCHWPD